MSKLETNTIDTISGSTNLTLGGTNATDITIPSGVTLTNNGTQAGLTLSDNILFNTANKGIYLGVTSATASNLLDDYEEGTWTPTYSTTGTDFTSVTYDDFRIGTYTKIGNICYVIAKIRTDAVTIGSASGSAIIDGLPFTVAETNSFTVGASASFTGDVASNALGWVSNTGILLYYRTSANGNTSGLVPADFSTAANSNIIYVNGFYRVA